jgi:hypothetical protein
MPTSISELIENVGLELAGQVKWGNELDDDKPGIYIVALSCSSTDKEECLVELALIDFSLIESWIHEVPTLKLDNSRPTPKALADRLSEFWLPDEAILYIGKAGKSVKKRVNDYYHTRLGDRRPHAGGHWIKTLSILQELYIFWALTNQAERTEKEALETFINNVSKQTRRSLFDRSRPFPFANLEYPKGNTKRHGIRGSANR